MSKEAELFCYILGFFFALGMLIVYSAAIAAF